MSRNIVTVTTFASIGNSAITSACYTLEFKSLRELQEYVKYIKGRNMNNDHGINTWTVIDSFVIGDEPIGG